MILGSVTFWCGNGDGDDEFLTSLFCCVDDECDKGDGKMAPREGCAVDDDEEEEEGGSCLVLIPDSVLVIWGDTAV